MRVGVWCIAAIVAMGCGTTDPASSSGGSSSSGGTIGGSSGDGGKTTTADKCSAAAQLVYVVSAQNDLYSFTPNKGSFKRIGNLDCPAPTGITPNSMAIDRQGNAWINYTDGSLFKASTEDASCKETTFEPNQVGFKKFGMAFATTGPGEATETLFISGLDDNVGAIGKGFGKVDLKSMKITMLGDYSAGLSGRGAELTGTGDGKLYGFFTTSPNATLAEVDRTRGDTTNDTSLEGVQTRESWAFSFWGGDFWFYTAAQGTPSTVQRLSASGDNSITVTSENVGDFRIVGAGVSTCAPTEPPK